MKSKKETYFYYIEPYWFNRQWHYVALWPVQGKDIHGRKFKKVKITVEEVKE